MKCRLFLIAMMLFSVSSLQAAITGKADPNTLGSWRTAAEQEADSEYGTDGYVIYGFNASGYISPFDTSLANPQTLASLPFYLDDITTTPTAMWSGDGNNFGIIEDPTAGNADHKTPVLANGDNPYVLTITRSSRPDAAGAFRVTIMFADGDGADLSWTNVTASDGVDSASVTVGQNGANNASYVVFDIDSTADTFTITTADNAGRIVGLAFDNGPEALAPEVVGPENEFVFLGETAVFTVSATDPAGGTLTYQWAVDPNVVAAGDETDLNDSDPDISGATTDTLMIANVEQADVDAGMYFCKVSNGNITESDRAAIKVKRLLGYWAFDGDATDSVADNDGSTGVSLYVAGRLGQAIRFKDIPGGQDRTEADAVKILTTPYDGMLEGQFTLSWWELSEPNIIVNDWDTMVALGAGAWQEALYPYSETDPYHYRNYFGGGGYVDGPDEWTYRMPTYERYNVWHMHVVTFDGQRFRKYLNGMEIPSQAAVDGITDFNANLFNATMTSLPNPIWVGNEDDAYGTFNNGLDAAIDELKLYSFAQTADEVAQDYLALAGGSVCQLTPGHTNADDILNNLPVMDLDGDCDVDIADLQVFAEVFLTDALF